MIKYVPIFPNHQIPLSAHGRGSPGWCTQSNSGQCTAVLGDGGLTFAEPREEPEGYPFQKSFAGLLVFGLFGVGGGGLSRMSRGSYGPFVIIYTKKSGHGTLKYISH